jgi:hypothetical protein
MGSRGPTTLVTTAVAFDEKRSTANSKTCLGAAPIARRI